MKKTTIILDNGSPFTYDDESDDITYDTITPISDNDAKELLDLMKSLFTEQGLRFSLVFGTLLGAVRDKCVIEGDEDVDVFVESEERLRRILPFLQQNNLCVCRICEHFLYSFRIRGNKAYIDVYIKRQIPGIWGMRYCYLCGHVLPKRLIKQLNPLDFLGGTYLVPRKPERFLEFWYGKTWKTPISGDHTKHGTTLYDKWNNTKGAPKIKRVLVILKMIIKQIISGNKIY